MHGLHHQQQQLAALLAAALPKEDSSSEDDSARVTAINSLHRAILHPHNALLVGHSSSFLSQGLFQLLSDKSYSVRQSAVIAYGSLCSIACSSQLASNGRPSSAITGGLAERFIGWALPQLRDVSVESGAAELALEGLREFLNSGDAVGIERFVLPILKSCQELLEDERTSLDQLRQLLGLLTLVSLKFSRCFQSHFVDIVDLLLGWALVPDLLESDRCIIMDSFVQFQKHWLGNLQFSLGLLSKFLGDMEVLLQDGTPGTPQQFRRLLALLSCFLTILQVTASGMLEMNMLEQINEPLAGMLPQLLASLTMVGRSFGWSKWIGESLRCLILLAEILHERFSTFYPMAVDILFQNLGVGNASLVHTLPTFQVHGVLKTNLQLLSLQKLSLLPASVKKILHFDSPLAHLRLHPNQLVTGSLAATYLYLLQHGSDGVVGQAIASLLEELELLRSILGKIRDYGYMVKLGDLRVANASDSGSDLDLVSGRSYSELELIALIKFDLKVLLSCVCLGTGGISLDQVEVISHYERSIKLTSFIIEKLNPFTFPIQGCVELQVHVVSVLCKLSEVEFLRKHTIAENSRKTACDGDNGECDGFIDFNKVLSVEIIEYLKKYTMYIVSALDASSPLTVKLEALEWIYSFCGAVITLSGDFRLTSYIYEPCGHGTISGNLLFSVLGAASDRELRVRSQVASILELLLQTGLIYPSFFCTIAEVALEKLGDSNLALKNAFVRVLSIVLPLTVYTYGSLEIDVSNACRQGGVRSGERFYWHWKQLFALKQLPQQLRPQQFVSILNYISHRWKVPLSSWIQRLVFGCHSNDKEFVSSRLEEREKISTDSLWKDLKIDANMLDKICSTNNLAAVWWSIHEAARHCITVRLRTHLGGPTQTFAALERLLFDIVHVLQLETEQSEGSVSIGSSGAHLLPMRLLLDFVEALKKNIYNAYDGSSVLPSASRQSSLFFRANKKVCEEWFARICEPMMNAGLALQCHTATLNYCALRLQDLRNIMTSALKETSRTQVAENLHNVRAKIGGDVLRVLRHASLALCRSHEPEALVGLQKWAVMAFSSLLVDDNQPMAGHRGNFGTFSWITGLVYQADGQYEKAAAHFSHLLQSEEALNSMGSDGVQFAIARVIESYAALSDWKSLEAWLLELQALRAKHAGKSYSGALTTAGNEINALYALARFDEGDFQASWGYLDLTPKSSNELTIGSKQALQRSEQMLLQAMLRKNGKVDQVAEEIEKAKLMLEEALSVVPLDGLTETASYAIQLHCIHAFEEGCKLHGHDGSGQVSTVLNSLHQVVQSPLNKIHQDCNLWLKVLRVYRAVQPNSPVTLHLCRQLISLARKQRNFMMAHRLHQYLMNHLMMLPKSKSTDWLIRNLQYESIKLMYKEDKREDALTSLWSLVRTSMLSLPTDTNDMLKAKACLKLASWLRQGSSDVNWENVLMICSNYHSCGASSFNPDGVFVSDSKFISDTSYGLLLEEIVGTATKISSLLCPTLGKSWLSYASWCYSQAKCSLSAHDSVLQSCSLSPILLPEVSPSRFRLNKEEISGVEAKIINFLKTNKDVKTSQTISGEVHLDNDTAVKALVQQVVCFIEAAAGAPGVESSDGESATCTLISQLQVAFHSVKAGIEQADILSLSNDLVDIWWSLRRRRVSLFGHAAHGYLQYLSQSTSKVQESPGAGPHLDFMKQMTGSCTLRATLYVLHILLNYGVELQDTLEPGLATVPLLPWQDIIPQLFARLSSHPEQVVRKQLEDLLMMLAKLSPWSIVYPTLVDINAYDGEPSEELQHILGCLVKLHPNLVRDVQLVINELGIVTVLWEEQWLSTLQDLHTDVLRRINLLKEEAARVSENVTLSQSEKTKINAAKYSAMMAPVAVALERRLASTSRKPETAHEIWFQKEYGEALKSAILTFKMPPASAAALGDVWRPFDVIAASLATHQRKQLISLSDVAPQLALLLSSDVPMPGLEKQISVSDSTGNQGSDLQGIITISSFCEQVTILSTKTKPKKLVILGSDGQKYTYLLKGREDLRLDARIMQLLQAINNFLYSCNDTNRRSLAIRYYSVTPISGRAGLIQWVDNVISIYSVFKHWQNRAQLAQVLAIGSGNVKNTVPPVPRPSDMFYGKIIPALKEKGIRRVISRRDWPHEVKRKVLLDLMKETPRQLLYQEIWCASEGFKAFSSKLKRFSGSVAAMSMVGHMLGLGDRHLDNILMDFSTGDVVHIDYNVCFDKGQRLKIPEIVPFRLTQTIETALGLTGIEGAFRANCEAVVGVLRKNKDIVLMLLEVFVWDPLIEWTRGDGHDEAAIGGEERKGMELAVSLSLFASRVQEIRVPLQEHHDLFLSTLPAAESSLEKFSDLLNQYEVVSALFYRADQERSTLILHETSAKSIAAEATCNSEKTRASFEVQAREFAQAKTVAIEKSKEAALWIEQHGRVLDALRSGSILEIKTLIELSGMEEALSLTAAVPVAGVPLTIVPEPTLAQCHDLDREVAQLIAELDSGLSCSVKALQAYSLELQRVLPLNYVTTSHVHGWAQVLQLAVNNLSSDVLALARRQASDLVAKAQADSVDSARQRHADLCFKVEQYIKEIKKVEEDCCEVMNSIESETEAKSKDRLLSAFTKFMHSSSHLRKEEDESAVLLSQNKYEKKDSNIVPVDLEEKKAKVLSMLRIVASALYKEVKDKVFEISSNATERIVWGHGEGSVHHSSKVGFCGLEEQIEKCVLVAGFVDELQHLIGFDLPKRGSDTGNVKHAVEGNWASVFQASILSCRSLIEQITGAVLSEIIKSFVSYNSEVMDAFGSLSQIRGSIDTALEQLVEVELERASLMELEQNYFVKVGLITEQQLALGEASVQGREHLSWEEAEELATQEEACRAQLDQLHQTWSQKDMHTSSLTRREANIRNTLISSKQQFLSLINVEHGGDLRVIRSKFLLATLAKPFNELESIDQMLSSLGTDASYSIGASFNLADFVTSGYSLSESIWKVARLLKNHSFFIWKIGIIDSFLDSCIHDISSSLDHNLGFDQVCNVLKMKLEFHLQEYVDRYMRERVAVVLLERLEKETEYLKRLTEEMKEFGSDYIRRDAGAVKRVQLMLEEYCNAHETARAARSAVSLMKKQVNELTQNLHKATLEAIQMEWLHDLSLPNLHRSSVISQYVLSDNNLSPVILNLDRSKLLENIRSGLSSIARSMECLQSYERTSVSAEGQLERAMVWACAGPNTSSTSNSLAKSLGIPPEFHGHIMKRRQLLWEAQEQAADVMKVCTSVLEFEASRDGIFRMPGEISPGRPTGDDRTWQQAYLNALTRLDVTYHSFARAEQEWKLAQSNMEAASSSLFSATNELCIASVKAKSASGDLQGTLASMRDCAYEASVALSAFGRVTRGHTALTSECGSMLEEVLAITEGIHDVYSLGKEAASVHGALMTDLTKVNSILLPLEPILASDVAAMADAMSRERESTSEIPPIHGQALYQSYCLRLREACQSLRSLVPSLMYSVKELHAMLTRLARSASIHAGNLHEALEGLGESQVGRSQEIVLSRSELVDHAVILDDKDKDLMQSSNGASGGEFTGINGFSQQYEEWISPPGSIYSSSPSSSITSTDEASLSDNSDSYANPTKQLFYGVSAGDTVDNSSPITSAQKSDFGEKLESQCSEAGTDGVDIASTSVASGEPLQASSFSNEATDRQANDFYNTEKDIHGEISSLVGKNEGATANEVKGQHESNGDPSPCMDPASWVARGKNAYALSVLRRVEMKLDGQDINDGRQLSISDQVDHLLRQATSIDNLCNMYEGWTPWI